MNKEKVGRAVRIVVGVTLVVAMAAAAWQMVASPSERRQSECPGVPSVLCD